MTPLVVGNVKQLTLDTVLDDTTHQARAYAVARVFGASHKEAAEAYSSAERPKSRPHWRIIVDDLLEHPGSTWLEVTLRTYIPSPHRRSPEWQREGWTVRTEVRVTAKGVRHVHFAERNA